MSARKKPSPYSPEEDPSRTRVSYVEEIPVHEKLKELAKKSGLTVSDILRQAAWAYVSARLDPTEAVDKPTFLSKNAKKKAGNKSTKDK